MNLDDKDYLSFNNMYKGLKKSCRNVRWKTSVTSFEINAIKNTRKALDELESESYKISNYKTFTIYEPKKRIIKATKIRDRQIQRCLCDNYIYENLTKSFIYDNCACQIGKGTDFALNRMKTHLSKYYRRYRTTEGWYLKCDIHHFFESIDHGVAKKFIRKYIKDDFIYNEICKIIDSFGECGIGLGSQVSQLIALTYLNELDHIIKEKYKIKYYIRYMDDFILIDNNKEKLKECKHFIEEYLSSLNLSLNKKTTLQKLKFGIKFLNWKFSLTNSGKVIMTQNAQKIREKKQKLKYMHDLNLGNETASKTLESMITHLSKGNCNKYIYELKSLYKNLFI